MYKVQYKKKRGPGPNAWDWHDIAPRIGPPFEFNTLDEAFTAARFKYPGCHARKCRIVPA